MSSLLARASKQSVETIARRAQAMPFCAIGAAKFAIVSRPRTAVTSTSNFRRHLPAVLLCKSMGVSLGQRRFLETEAEFHPIADETLETIQDAMDKVFDGQPEIEYEVTLANGVLNLSLPPHGTWVFNKQTPNRQIWWSSPLSGPKRFEYDDKDKLWICTKDGLKLGFTLAEEIHHFYPELDKLDLDV